MSVSKNILIVTQDFPPVSGGIQTYLFERARHFHKRGHRVTVICPGGLHTPSPLPPEIPVLRIRIHTSWLFLPLMFRLPGILRRGGYTHVLYAQWQAALSELFVPRARKRHRALCLVHGRETLRSIFGPLHGFMCRLAFRRVDVGIPNSHAVLELTRRAGRPRAPLHLVHPAVDPHLFRPAPPEAVATVRRALGIPDEGPLVLGVGRMVRRKNMEGVLRAFATVRPEFPDAWLVLVGDGPERAKLEMLAAEWGCGERVRFPGTLSHEPFIREYGASVYAAADVFAMPCLDPERDVEGFGIVYLEAGACEIPVIGSRVGGIPDAVVEGETGLLIEPGNQAGLDAALRDLLRRPDRGRSLGRAARARILRGLTWEKTGDAVLATMV